MFFLGLEILLKKIMKLEIVFEDREVLVLNKPAGLVVNRSQTIKEETLQDQLSEYFNLGSSLGIGDRAGIVHRLDRETSGLLLVAKTPKAFENLQDQFRERKVEKEYVCLAHGQINQDSGVIEGDVGRIGKFGKFGIVEGGRESRTEYKVIKKYEFTKRLFDELLPKVQTKSRINYLIKQAKKYTLLNLFPKTGRTHQIRVHIKSIGHPVVSDLIYTPKKLLKFDFLWCPRLFLHASKIKFTHPKSKKDIEFKSGLPGDLKDALSYLTLLHFAKRQLRGGSN